MKRNTFSGSAGTGPNDKQIFGPNPNRKALVITYGGSGTLVVAIGKSTAGGTVGDLLLQAAGGPIILTHAIIGDSITEEVNCWNSAGSQPVGAMEFFES